MHEVDMVTVKSMPSDSRFARRRLFRNGVAFHKVHLHEVDIVNVKSVPSIDSQDEDSFGVAPGANTQQGQEKTQTKHINID